MNGLILPIITIIIISLLRIRCIRQIFEHSNTKAFIITSITSSVSVICITLLYYFKQHLHITEDLYIYMYAGVIILSSIIYFRKQRFGGRIIQSIIWISIALLGGTWGSYSIAALGEESFKWTYIKKYITGLLGEIILLGIISGIVFGRTENLVYIIQHIAQNKQNDTVVSIIQQRGFIPIIVHIGSICLSLIIGFSLKKNIHNLVSRCIAIIIGISSHYLFNISQVYHFSLGTGFIILGYLIIISYSIFRSDMLYVSK